MSRFYVGQRVRVLRMKDPKFKWVEGMEAIVNELDCINQDDEGGLVGFTCAGEDDWCAPPEHLAPITDSYDKASWDECAWKTEHLRDEVRA